MNAIARWCAAGAITCAFVAAMLFGVYTAGEQRVGPPEEQPPPTAAEMKAYEAEMQQRSDFMDQCRADGHTKTQCEVFFAQLRDLDR
jgi:hypothetical protein